MTRKVSTFLLHSSTVLLFHLHRTAYSTGSQPSYHTTLLTHFLTVYMLARSLDSISTKNKKHNNPSLQQFHVSNTNSKRRGNAQQTKELKELLKNIEFQELQ